MCLQVADHVGILDAIRSAFRASRYEFSRHAVPRWNTLAVRSAAELKSLDGCKFSRSIGTDRF